LFDLGSFAIDDSMRLVVSSRANGPGLDAVIFNHVEQQIALPRLTKNHPSQEFFDWHRREVFKT
jgi:putative restriction endonuclease